MISLRDLHKSYRQKGGITPVFEGLNLNLPARRCIGVLGGPGSGKTTLLKLLCGLEQPDRGEINVDGRVAIPFGHSPALTPQLSARENVTFVARVFGEPMEAMMRKVEELADLGVNFDHEIGGYDWPPRQRLNYAILMAVDFDWYMVDEQLPLADPRHRGRFASAFEAIKQRAGMLIATSRLKVLRQHCDSVIVLHERGAQYHEDLESGLLAYRDSRPGGGRQGKARGRGDRKGVRGEDGAIVAPAQRIESRNTPQRRERPGNRMRRDTNG